MQTTAILVPRRNFKNREGGIKKWAEQSGYQFKNTEPSASNIPYNTLP
jgi:hypothetical protein